MVSYIKGGTQAKGVSKQDLERKHWGKNTAKSIWKNKDEYLKGGLKKDS